MRGRLNALTAEVSRRAERELFDRLKKHFRFQKAKTVMVYLALPGELSLDRMIEVSWQEDRCVVAPRVEGGRLQAYRIQNLDADVREGRYGVREPAAKGPAVDLAALDVVFVPGLAFDRMGWRLGRGGGFYDRFLGELPETVHTLGICHAFQVVESVPYGSNDTCVDEVLAV